jgi:chromosome segregation ATPase
MEARIARLESDVSHLRTDVADIKVDLRALRDKVDGVETSLRGEIKGLEKSLQGEIKDLEKSLRGEITDLKDDNSSLRHDIAAVRVEIASAKSWGLALSMTLTGVMLTVMARGFGWM